MTNDTTLTELELLYTTRDGLGVASALGGLLFKDETFRTGSADLLDLVEDRIEYLENQLTEPATEDPTEFEDEDEEGITIEFATSPSWLRERALTLALSLENYDADDLVRNADIIARYLADGELPDDEDDE